MPPQPSKKHRPSPPSEIESICARALKTLDLSTSQARLVVAMSGGVDSSVAAALLAFAGYDVIGVTLQLYNSPKSVRKGSCCAGQDIYDAKQVAEKIGFPHYVLDYESRFQETVIDQFADSYLRGETPIPCIQCNQEVKFKDLLKTALDLEAQALVTGHYVQRYRAHQDQAELHQAADPSRDQSYFLFGTTQEQLDFLRFPLGGLLKSETRKLATFFGLEIATKPDSQDICFVQGGSYASLIEKLRPESIQPGEIVHLDGRTLGQHKGIINFTIGQRRGLNLSTSDPLFVIDLDIKNQRVIVGPREALACKKIVLRDVNWLGSLEMFEGQVKIRSTQRPLDAHVVSTSPTDATVTLHEPEYGIALGQACTFYDGSRIRGGGWIHQTVIAS